MTLLLWYAVGAGLLLAALSIPLWLRKIGPNPWYGFRVQQTLNDPTLWYPVNAFAAKGLFVVGLCTCTAAIGLYFIPGMVLDFYALAVAGVALGGLAVTLILSFRYLAHLANKSSHS